MITVERDSRQVFAVWITGLPASGKSSLASALRSGLAERGIDVAVLESDVLRRVFTPHPRYDEAERDLFYRQMTCVGTILLEHGVPVIFDATATRRRYRDQARRQIPKFLEVFVDSPLEVCVNRDPKGIYRKGRDGGSQGVPGLQTAYEPPESPDVTVHGDREMPQAAAQRIIATLVERGYL